MTKHNILLIEENHSERVELNSVLENWGYSVFSAHDGNDAIDKLKNENIRFIIASHETPGLSPVDFLTNTKLQNKETQILFLSSNPSVSDAVDVMKEGALDYIVKPIDHDQLRLFVEKVFHEESLVEKSRKGKKNKKTEIVTKNKDMARLLDLTKQIANSSASVLIQGESGTGKELFARYIHEYSKRSKAPFIALNCAALPETLLESELFGHEKGAFTGAVSRKPGKFELADGGTLLLDEVTEMQIHLQSKLLRVLQEQEVDRLGGLNSIKVDVRVVATTNRDVLESIKKGEFREDLYYRLNVVPIKIPSLRHRIDDVEILADYFIDKYNKLDGRSVRNLTKEALLKLKSLSFNGNVREMENLIHRAILLSDGEIIKETDLLLDNAPPVSETATETSQPSQGMAPGSLKEVEKKMIFTTLDKTEGNRTHAAKILGISVRTLRNKLNEYKEKK